MVKSGECVGFFFFFFLTARTCSCRADKRWKKLRQVSLGIVGGLRLTRPDWPGSAGIYTNLCLWVFLWSGCWNENIDIVGVLFVWNPWNWLLLLLFFFVCVHYLIPLVWSWICSFDAVSHCNECFFVFFFEWNLWLLWRAVYNVSCH